PNESDPLAGWGAGIRPRLWKTCLDEVGIVLGDKGTERTSPHPSWERSSCVPVVTHKPSRFVPVGSERPLFVAKERVERDEEDLVGLYLTDIGQYPLLTKDDEVRLAQQIEAGNGARGELLTATKDLTGGKKRELRRTARDGDNAQRTFVQ